MVTLAEDTQTRLAASDTLPTLLAHLANGGSPIDLAEQWTLRWCDIHAWLRDDPDRNKAYEQALLARSEWMAQRVIGEIKALALVDLRTAYDDHGNLLPIKDLPDAIARSITQYETETYTDLHGEVTVTRKIRFADKLAALKLLGQTVKLFLNDAAYLGAGLQARSETRIVLINGNVTVQALADGERVLPARVEL